MNESIGDTVFCQNDAIGYSAVRNSTLRYRRILKAQPNDFTRAPDGHFGTSEPTKGTYEIPYFSIFA